jgi:uncharacterized protein (DUF2147 family)
MHRATAHTRALAAPPQRAGNGAARAARPSGMLLAGAVLLAVCPIALARAEPSVAGRWLTDDGKGIVGIFACGPHICGRIVEVLDNRPNVPRTDVNNPDRRLRSRPILGLTTLSGFTESGSVWSGGRAYDPKSGRSYRSSLALNRDGTLKVTGCLLFICQSKRWTRVR